MGHWAVNTVFLAATNFITGTIGFVYRLILSKYLGPEGMGVYQQTLAFFGTAITVITAGIPVSVSKLVAENRANTSKKAYIVLSAFALTTFFSLVGVTFLIFLSNILELKLLLIVLPASVFVGYSSVMRGYFLGIQDTTPVQWSSISECIFRTLFGVIFISGNLFLEFEGKTRGAVSALTIGEFISLGSLCIFFIRSIGIYHYSRKNSVLKYIKDILTIAIPISFSQIINSISRSVEALLVPKGLVLSGLSSSEGLALYGKTSGMVMPLIFFPALFVRAMSSNIIPQIARALALKNKEYAFKLSQQALFLTSFFAFAVAAFFIALSEPIAELLFPGFELGNLIIGFSAGIPFYYIESILMSILRGIGNNTTPITTAAATLFITNQILYFLTSKTPMGIYGYSVALITASAIAIYISIRQIEQTFEKQFNRVEIILKPMICCVFMTYIMSQVYLPLVALDFPNIICIAADLILGLSGYSILALALGINLRSLKQKY
ncbi:MAG: oligosaccharide flippase family protein [Thermoanaerobacteraceae bacterium]|nr:oligosaccharide flippase family protein [Thermoanaerobacteraceae bacterium]